MKTEAYKIIWMIILMFVLKNVFVLGRNKET